MDQVRRQRLAEVMAALRDDEAAVVALYLEFGDEVGQVVRFVAGTVAPGTGAEELEELTLEACFAVADVAGGWRADGGALPWVWARRRIDRLVRGRLLHPEVELPPGWDVEDRAAPAVDDDDVPALAVLERLAAGDERCAALSRVIGSAGAGQDVEVLLRYRVQQQAGDPAPAHTVAAQLGLRPPAVRQRASRARRRLAAAVAADPSAAAVGALALLQPPRRSGAAA